ncbi:MAG: ABC transporter permease [Balneolales bacterium]|nr:ABC transporter permease [Balneolales bacterium]
MLSSYIKTAWRNFTRNRFYSLINVLGLSVGFTCLILVLFFVSDELSYDEFHANKEQIHLIASESEFGGTMHRSLYTPYPIGPEMKEEVSEVKHYVSVIKHEPGGRVSVDGENFTQEGSILMATESFFEVFSFPLKAGNTNTALKKHSSVVISEHIAAKYFPNENPIGKAITIDYYGNKGIYTITGVTANTKKKSYLNFDFLLSAIGSPTIELTRTNWYGSVFHTFVKLQHGTDWKIIEDDLERLVDKNIGQESKTVFFSIPISRLYISDLVLTDGFHGSMKYIYIFSSIALFILLLACINYINLATAKATNRAREVGIRKVAGAGKKQLTMQFIGEALFITTFSFMIALGLSEAALPFFNHFIGGELNQDIISEWKFTALLFGISVFVGILSGSYPAFFLSHFTPSQILKGKQNIVKGNSGFRRTSVTTQLFISISLIACTIIIFNQLRFVLEKDLGFEGEQVMYIPMYESVDRIEPFKQLILDHSAVVNASAAAGIPGAFYQITSQSFDPANPDNRFAAYLLKSDENYQDVLGFELLEGRFFSDSRITDQDNARVINEAMLARLGWGTPKEAIGRKFADGSELIGVVKNFHFRSLYNQIAPVYIQMKPSDASLTGGYNLLAIRFEPGQVSELIEYLQKTWFDLGEKEPLTYHFLDEQFASLYETDKRLSQAFSFFTGIGIFIACLGLIGLSAFSAEQRTKEVGIRKVMGATVYNIFTLLSAEFIRLVFIGFVISVPVSWFIMDRWLTEFAYRIDIGVEVFLAAGISGLLITVAATSWQALKAASANPVKSLRNE